MCYRGFLIVFLYGALEPSLAMRVESRDKEILFKLTVKVPVVGITADTPNPPGLLPF